jgi:uncharacterized radical SAM superfamily Fe-S cluster-containing enzyme
MSRLPEREYTYFTTVRGMCRACRRVVPARVFFRGMEVWQQSLCPACRPGAALIAADKDWYLDQVLREFPDRAPLKGAHAPQRGCPHDCGPCTWHASPCQLPVVSVTNVCELRCPICFTYNRADKAYFMPVEEFRRTVDWIVESSGPVDLINVTGGEPTRHPEILELLAAAKRPGIGRVTMNSNGLRLAEDYDLCRRLADLGVYVVLSFHTFDPAISVRMHGKDLVGTKIKAIENLTRAGVGMTLLNVLARGVNDHEVGALLRLMLGNERILSLTIQTLTYTGQGGGSFPRTRHLPIDETARLVSVQSEGQLRFEDFMSRPSAHPLCYLTCCALCANGRLLPLARVMPREALLPLVEDSYLPRVPDGERFFRDLLDSLYAQGRAEELKSLRQLVASLYPEGEHLEENERRRRTEAAVRTVYLHAHMDEDNFDTSRAMLCPDLVPAEPGRLIPACTYNLFYRRQDERFYAEP